MSLHFTTKIDSILFRNTSPFPFYFVLLNPLFSRFLWFFPVKFHQLGEFPLFSIIKRASNLRIGLDIQADVVRLLALEWSKPFSVKHYGEVALPKAAIQDGKCNDYNQVVLAIQSLVQEASIRNQKVQIALPFRTVIMKTIQLPNALSDEECEMEIETHLSHYLPGVNGALHFDFMRLTEEDAQEILLVATKNEIIDFYCGLVSHAGLQVNAVDVDVYALARGISFGLQAISTLTIVELAEEAATVIVMQRSRIIFHEQIIYSSNETSEALAIKIRQCLRIFNAMHHDINIEKMILTGSRIALFSIADYFSDLSLECYASIPAIKAVLQKATTRYARAVGLALWGVEDD